MCNLFFAQVKLFSLSHSLSLIRRKYFFLKAITKKFGFRGKVFNRHACWRGLEPERDKVMFQEKFHYVHIGHNLRWIFDALPIQNPIDINRAATLSPDLQNVLQNLKPSRLFSANRLIIIFMNKFFILEWIGETGSLHAFKCKYICTEVHANLIAQSRTIYLVAMSFGENMWGETSSIFC